jgi:hypothetical protein
MAPVIAEHTAARWLRQEELIVAVVAVVAHTQAEKIQQVPAELA